MESFATDAAERKMDPRVIGADDIKWSFSTASGRQPSGERFDGEVIGVYELRDFKMSRAQMFYFDEAALVSSWNAPHEELEANETLIGRNRIRLVMVSDPFSALTNELCAEEFFLDVDVAG